MTEIVEYKLGRILLIGSIKSMYRNKQLVFKLVKLGKCHFSDLCHCKETVQLRARGNVKRKDFSCTILCTLCFFVALNQNCDSQSNQEEL